MDLTLFHSPNGRYACRQGFERDSMESNLCSIHFIDFEEETLHEMFLVTFMDFRIIFIYWVDDTHICTLFQQDQRSAENNEPDTIRPKRALYKVDFEGKYIQPKIVSYWNPDERGFIYNCGFQISQGFLTVNEQDYLIVDDIPENIEYTFDDENATFWLRFIPKHFEDVREIDDVVINATEAVKFVKQEWHCGLQKIFAYKHLLYFSLNHGGCLILDMDKYFKLIKETSKPPSPSEYCRGITIEPILQYGGWLSMINNRFIYLLERDEEYKQFIRICDLESECASGLFEISNPLIIQSNCHPSRDECIHPSGQYIQYEALAGEYIVHQDNSARFRFVPRKNFTYKFVSLKPVLTGLSSLKKLAAANVMLNEIQIEEKLPRCLREGRNTVNLSIIEEDEIIEIPDWFIATVM